MLNELHSLSQTLDGLKIKPDTWHREYKELPNVTVKAPCFRIWISDSGSITGIDTLEPATVKFLRKYGDNQATFPAFNIKPLYRVTYGGQKREDNWLKSMKRIDKLLEAKIDKFMKAIGSTGEDEAGIVAQLVKSVRLLTRRGLRNTLEANLVAAIARGENRLLGILEFNGTDDKIPENDPGANISVFLDLAAWQDYGYPVASEETTKWINAALIRSESEVSAISQSGGLDAFGSSHGQGVKSEPMPEVKLSGFTVTLRSMFNGQPCQKRYGLFDDASYPISKPNRAGVKGALEWIACAENERKTWVKADVDEIAFAYPSELPKVSINHAALLGGIGVQARFGQLAEDFTKAFRALLPQEKPKNIRIFSIRRMDRGRSKIVFTRNLAPEGYIKAAEEWQAGYQNIPSIAFTEPAEPFPLDAARIVNTVWKQDGEQISRPVRRMQVYQGIELMLDFSGNSPSYFLSVLVSNIFGLVAYAGNKRSSAGHSKKIADAAALLGIFLYKCGYRKENYMKDTAFLTGQFLKVSDELHALYGKVVRDDVPPQLVGASMLTAASDAPDKALSQLCARMNPYITWAKSYRFKNISDDGKQSWRAGWLLSLYENIAIQLNETLTEPVRFNDFDKAQFFLGYLAAFPKRPDIINDAGIDTDTDKGEKDNE